MVRATTNSIENAQQVAQKPNARQLVRACNRDFELKQDSFAAGAGCASSDFSNALNDKQRLDIQWVMNQSTEYQMAFIEKWTAALGMTPEQVEREAMRMYLNKVHDYLNRRPA